LSDLPGHRNSFLRETQRRSLTPKLTGRGDTSPTSKVVGGKPRHSRSGRITCDAAR
jgi:hypothetical protein